MVMNRRTLLTRSVGIGAGALAAPYFFNRAAMAADTLDVGVVFSLTGVTSIIEKSLADATLMAISEINAQGGVMGKQIRVIQEDGASDPRTYAEKASKLVVRDRLNTVFGGLTSASRKAVLPIFERRNSLFFYPTYYEGYECSKNVIYGGAVPNQQLSNFIPWIIKNLGKKKFFIVGSNYIYPQEMSKVCKILIEENGAEWIADEHLELGEAEWGAMVNKIKNSGCDAVISNVVGDSVVAFYREYKNQGLSHDKLPICATVTSEIEIAAMGAEYAVGAFTSFPYFQAIESDANQSFIERYRTFVKDRTAVTHHAMECAYSTVFLWKQAVEKAQDTSPDAVREAIRGQEFDAPDGRIKIEPNNLHTWLTPRIAQWQADGQGKIVHEFEEAVMPLPYAAYGESSSNLFCTPNGVDKTKLKI